LTKKLERNKHSNSFFNDEEKQVLQDCHLILHGLVDVERLFPGPELILPLSEQAGQLLPLLLLVSGS
jgi:hypothetical protein